MRDDFNRPWSHVDPSEPGRFPSVPFEEIMSGDEGVANWTKEIV